MQEPLKIPTADEVREAMDKANRLYAERIMGLRVPVSQNGSVMFVEFKRHD